MIDRDREGIGFPTVVMAATAPTFAAQGTASFCTPAKIKILLVPAAPLDVAEFEKWASFVRNIDCLRLRDVPRAKSSVYPSSPLHQQGEVHVQFVTSYDPRHAYLAPLQLHRQVLGVLGLTTYDERAAYTQDLPRVAGLLRNEHPNALVHRVFAFDADPREVRGDGDMATLAADEATSEFQPQQAGFSGRRDGGLFVFPAVRRDAKDVRFYLRTQLAELVGAVLDQLDTLVAALEGTSLETPRETLTDSVSPAIRAAMNKSSSLAWGRGQTPLDAPPLPPRQGSTSTPPPGAASKVFSALSKRKAAPGTAPPTSGPHGSARHAKVRGDLALLSGDLWSALELYDSLLTLQGRERALAGGQDAVWFASALEGWAVARMLVARLGGAAHDQAPCLAFTLLQPKDKEKDVRETIVPSLAWKDIAEAYALALAVYAKCLAPPQVQLESLRFVTNETPRDYTPPLVHAGASLAYSRFLLALWASGGWNGEAFDQMLFGGTPPSLANGTPPHTELSAHSGVYRDEIASAACGALTPALRTLPDADQIAVLGSVAKLLSLVGFQRRLAHVVRQLEGVVASLLARSFRAREPLSQSLSIETLLHEALRLRVPAPDTAFEAARESDGMHAAMNPALVLGLLACDTYGIDLLTVPVRHVPSSHILERARRRVCAEQYGALLEAAVGGTAAQSTLLPALAQSAEAAQLAKPAFGWTQLQMQMLKDLVVQSEALNDYVSMTYFATLLLRDFQASLAPHDQTALLEGLHRVVPLARRTAPELILRYYGPRDLLSAMEIQPLPAALTPVVRSRAVFDPPPPAEGAPLPAGVQNPFFWNTPRTTKPKMLHLVADEPMNVQVTLRNPLAIPLLVERIALVVDGEADTPPARTLVPPNALHIVQLQAIPKTAGTLAVEGVSVVLWSAEEHTLRLGVASEKKEAAGGKSTGLDARHSVRLLARVAGAGAAKEEGTSADVEHPPWTPDGVDALLAPSAAKYATCQVSPPMPMLDVSLPTLNTALALRDGQMATVPIRLANRSALPIDFVRFELDDSLQGPVRAAIADSGLLAGDVHELEWQLLYAPVLSVAQDAQTALRIPPRGTATVDLTVRGKASCEWASIRVYYGNTQGADDAALSLRTLQVPVPLSIQPSIECKAMAFHEVDTSSAERLAGQLTGATQKLGASFLLSLDLHNPSPHAFEAEVDVDAAPDVALHVSRIVAPQTMARVIVPMAKRSLATEALQAPIPKLSPRQFVVAKTKLSPEMQAACNAQFWLRNSLLESVRAKWKDTTTCGAISLRGQWPSVDQIRVFSQQKVQVVLALDDAHVRAEDLVGVAATITNHTESPLRMRLHLAPTAAAAFDAEQRAAEHTAAQVMVADGSWSSVVQPTPLAPGASATVRRSLCFLSAGTFALRATAEVLPEEPEQAATVFLSTPLAVHVEA